VEDYLTHNQVWDFVWINSTLILDKIQLRYILPGVFSINPQQGVNGSLWTLPYEVWMYISLVGLGAIGMFKHVRISNIFLSTMLIVLLAFPFLGTSEWLTKFANLQRFSLYFFAGAFVYLNRQWMPLKGLLALALCLGSIASRGTILYDFILPVALVYGVFWIAYVPSGQIRQYNRLGDYSYGTYIYAFPVQQSLIAVFPGIEPTVLFGSALGLTLLIASISWHFVENPFLERKGSLTKFIGGLKALWQFKRSQELL
jgi:peptidoglycan/LPS O-acetylase OafA/YrhL